MSPVAPDSTNNVKISPKGAGFPLATCGCASESRETCSASALCTAGTIPENLGFATDTRLENNWDFTLSNAASHTIFPRP